MLAYFCNQPENRFIRAPCRRPGKGWSVATIDPNVGQNRRRMVELLTELTPAEGFHTTLLDGVKVRRSDRNEPRTPVMYEPSVYFVASGRKRGYVGDRCLQYDANNYLVLSAPLPFECEVEVGEGGPLLGLSVRMDVSVISELAACMEVCVAQQSAEEPACVHATPLDDVLGGAVVRLLECLRSPVEAAVLGPAIKREITYRVLCGPRRETLFAMLGRNGDAARVHAVLRRMHARYAEPLHVARIAAEIGMSVSALHHHFKAVTSTSPVQYLKAVRLHKARMLILHDGIGASAAADRVGYKSVSQFGREFKRLFGRSPMEESRRASAMPGLSQTDDEVMNLNKNEVHSDQRRGLVAEGPMLTPLKGEVRIS
jgi:AraC-like DNA-binding protein